MAVWYRESSVSSWMFMIYHKKQLAKGEWMRKYHEIAMITLLSFWLDKSETLYAFRLHKPTKWAKFCHINDTRSVVTFCFFRSDEKWTQLHVLHCTWRVCSQVTLSYHRIIANHKLISQTWNKRNIFHLSGAYNECFIWNFQILRHAISTCLLFDEEPKK